MDFNLLKWEKKTEKKIDINVKQKESITKSLVNDNDVDDDIKWQQLILLNRSEQEFKIYYRNKQVRLQINYKRWKWKRWRKSEWKKN